MQRVSGGVDRRRLGAEADNSNVGVRIGSIFAWCGAPVLGVVLAWGAFGNAMRAPFLPAVV